MSNVIALRIAGTKLRQAGFVPLVNIGILPEGEGQKMYRSPLVNENPVVVIKHSSAYVLFLLIDCNVRPYDAAPSGALSIALSIPKEMQLSHGKSPYSMLMEIYECFRAENMTPMNDGRYCFIDREADDNSYRAILDKYPLEARRGPYVEMDPSGATGIVCVPQQHLDAFFKDTQYSEFRTYRDIEVGTSCQPSPGLEYLDIPRVTRYTVYLNGTRTNRTLAYPEDRYESDMEDTLTIEYGKVSFCLQDLVSSPDGFLSQEGGTVRLDERSSAIYCEVNKTEIHYSLQVQMDDTPVPGREALLKGIQENRIALKLGSRDITRCLVGSGEQIISAKDANNIVSITPSQSNGYRMLVKSKLDKEKRRLTVQVSYEKVVPTAVITGNPHQSTGEHGNVRVTQELPVGGGRKPPVSPPKSGLDWKNLALGVLVGFFLGCAMVFFVFGVDDGPTDNKDLNIIEDNKKEDSQNEDSLIRDIDDLKSLIETQKQEIGRLRDSLIYFQTIINQRNAILEALDRNDSYKKISGMPGFIYLNKNEQYAIDWLYNYNTKLENKDGYFKGDKTVSHSQAGARAATQYIESEKNNGSKWTWERLSSFQKQVVKVYKETKTEQ